MKKLKKADYIILAVLAVIIIGIVLLIVIPRGSDSKKNESDGASATETNIKDFDGKIMGIRTGSAFEQPTIDNFPNSQYQYFDTTTDNMTALKSGIIDGFLEDEPVAKMMCISNHDLAYFKTPLVVDNYSFAFQKGNEKADKLLNEFNELVKELWASGDIDKMIYKWMEGPESERTIDISGITGENGELLIALPNDCPPFSYYYNGELTGYALELCTKFAVKYGYSVKYEEVKFASMITGISTGKYDIAANSISVTEERKNSMNFSDTIYKGGMMLIVRSADASGSNVISFGNNSGSKEVEYTDYLNKRIGIITGTSFEAPTLEFFPDAEHLYYNSYSDIAAALKAGKIDGFLGDEPALRIMTREQPEISYIDKKLVDDNYAFGFTKNNERVGRIKAQFNEMLKEFYADGTMEELGNIWFGDDESKKVVDFNGLTGERLNVVTSGTDVPFSYYKDNQNVGLAMDLIARFCRKYGYEPHIEDVDFAARIPGLVSNKYDVCASSLSITPERLESIDFSDVIYEGGIVLAVKTTDLGKTPTSGNTVSDDVLKFFDGKKIGIQTGSSFEQPTFDLLPNGQYSYYDTVSDLVLALQQGKVDAFLHDEPIARSIAFEQKDLDYIKKPLIGDNYSYGYPKNNEKSDKLMKEFNELLKELKANGELEKISTKWIEGDPSERTIDDGSLNGENGKLTVGVIPDLAPFSYYENNKLVGIAIDLTTVFAKKYGYTVEYECVTVPALFAGLAGGKYDFAACNLSPTEERKESMNFSDTFYEGGINLVARKADLKDFTAGDASVSENIAEPEYTEYDGKRIGIQTGSSFEPVTFEKFPNSEYVYFENSSDLILALEQGKIDAFIEDEPVARMINKDNPKIDYLKKVLVVDDYHVGFQKDTESSKIYKKQFNEMLSELWASGEIDRLIDKWFNGDDTQKTIDTSGLTGENGELKVAARGNKPPFSYFENGRYQGYGIELITMFARKYGYTLTFDDTNLSAMLAGLSSGKYDIGISALSITEERKKSIDFSDTFYKGGMSLVVRSEDLNTTGTKSSSASSASSASDEGSEEKLGFFESIKDSFEKNFIREDRWKLILQGIGTTCIITLLTVLFGSILAFLICMFRRVDSVLASAICNLYVKLLQGTPMVVLLMILYYIVFGKSGLDAMWVAVIGFSLNFGAYGSEIMRSGIESIDRGQREAALALGFTENQGFFKFIFPQAAVRFLPVYRGEIISLLKNTSIVGYIAIQDLTKMSDIIRSRTFEAFFPLIATAVIYFILAWFISIALAKILKVVDPKQKKKGVKGVEIK